MNGTNHVFANAQVQHPAALTRIGVVARRLPGVIQVVDSLDLGGTETMAVNMANRLPRDRFRSYLCDTRPSAHGGVLASAIDKDVYHLSLNRKSRFDLAALIRFRRFVREHDIRLLHCHGSSLFFGRIASMFHFSSKVRVIWHDHYGRCEFNDRPVRPHRMAVSGVAGVIAVNQWLADWACRELRVSRDHVWYVRNFVSPSHGHGPLSTELPGDQGFRIVCVANMRPQKDHFTLIQAMATVAKHHPKAHLLLAGITVDVNYVESLQSQVRTFGLEKNVTFLGPVKGVASVLKACDVGVLSSASEGLPLSLIEYGWAGLPSISTNVGQCAEVLDNGKAGILVPPSSPEALADALKFLLDSAARRHDYGRRLHEFVRKTFDPGVIVNQICEIYDSVLSGN
jgi:glycosyltransferase involved in cell wall biosynthesis